MRSFAVLALVALTLAPGCTADVKPKGKVQKMSKAAAKHKNCKEQKEWKPASAPGNRVLFQKAMQARVLSAAGRPDPTCKTGVASMKGGRPDPRVCCPAYCKECTDYETCRSVNGQKSANACCASQVASMSCDLGKVAPNVCLKPCSESSPPCIIPPGEEFVKPDVTSAAEDCNEAVPEYMDTVESAVKAAKGGEAAWAKLEKD